MVCHGILHPEVCWTSASVMRFCIKIFQCDVLMAPHDYFLNNMHKFVTASKKKTYLGQ